MAIRKKKLYCRIIEFGEIWTAVLSKKRKRKKEKTEEEMKLKK